MTRDITENHIGMFVMAICLLFALAVFWVTDKEEIISGVAIAAVTPTAATPPEPLTVIAKTLEEIKITLDKSGKEKDVKPWDSRMNTPERNHLSDKYSMAWDAENPLDDGYVIAPRIYIAPNNPDKKPKESGTVAGVKANLYYSDKDAHLYRLEQPLEIEDAPEWTQKYTSENGIQ